MSQQVDTGIRTFTAGAAIAQYLRVKIAAGVLAAADAADRELGVMTRASFAAGDEVAVSLRNKPGTQKMVAGAAITQYAVVSGIAGGKVDDVVNGNAIGIALEAATADNDVIEVLRLDFAALSVSATIADAVVAHSITDAAGELDAANETELEGFFDALGVKVNAILAVLEANGLTASA